MRAKCHRCGPNGFLLQVGSVTHTAARQNLIRLPTRSAGTLQSVTLHQVKRASRYKAIPMPAARLPKLLCRARFRSLPMLSFDSVSFFGEAVSGLISLAVRFAAADGEFRYGRRTLRCEYCPGNVRLTVRRTNWSTGRTDGADSNPTCQDTVAKNHGGGWAARPTVPLRPTVLRTGRPTASTLSPPSRDVREISGLDS